MKIYLLKSNDISIKLIQKMKLTVLLLTLFVSGVFASNAVSQVEKVTLAMNNVTVAQVIDTIEEQTDYLFVYNKKEIDLTRNISVMANNKTVAEVLSSMFHGTNTIYAKEGDNIMLLAYTQQVQPQKQITGTVIGKDGTPLPGVNVVVTGTTQGTITDYAGKYNIEIPQGAKSLTFSFIGMEPQEVTIGSLAQINVTMIESAIGLDEVVVIGYSTVKRVTITGAISTVEGVKLQTAPIVNYTQSLAGRLPGLVSVNYSGEPGRDNATLRIRGSNTLGDNNPLIVIDGISGRSMIGLNAADIENITILKDASAAIYGAQAANGVILITTKRGSIKKSEVKVNLNQGWCIPTVIPEMADAVTYATMVNEMLSYSGLSPRYTPEEIQKFKDGSDPWRYPNTDWFSEVFKPSSRQNYGTVSLSGGTEKMKYYISSGFKFQDAIYKNSSTNYSQVDFRSNIDGKITDNIHLSVDLSGRQENGNYPIFNTWRIFGSLICGGVGSGGIPTRVAWYPGGRPAGGFIVGMNPVVMGTEIPGYQKDRQYIFTSNVKLLVTNPWIKGLSVSTNISFDKNIFYRKLWQVPYDLYEWDQQTFDANNEPVVTAVKSGFALDPQLTQNTTDGQNILLNALINYDVNIADVHNIKLLIGTEKNMGESINFWAYRRGFPSTIVDQMFAGADLQKDNGGSGDQYARMNYFGRFNYNYHEKYLLEFVCRYDGSYIFPNEGRFGFFPGISAGWRISEEGFWKNNLSFINYLKLRGSWGQTGNDRIEPYQYLSSYGFASYPYVFNTNVEEKVLSELRIPNEEITWEVANQSDIGLEGQAFNGGLIFSADYFYNLRTNILWMRNASIPASTGLSLPRENIGEVVNKGFEFQVGYNSKIGNFSYEVSFNCSYAKNKIMFWDETPGVPDYQQSTDRPMNSNLYYNAIGIFKDQAAVDAYPHWNKARPGDIIFEDVNGDSKIDGLDRVRYEKSDIPTLTGGIVVDLRWKEFYASILIQGAAGAVRDYGGDLITGGLNGNYLAEHAKGRWTEDNQDATKPRSWNASGEYWSSSINNTYWLVNNDYLRLKNLQIGYNIPTNFNKLFLSELTIYFSGLNLITLTHNKSFDPETIGLSYPLNKVYNLGVTITF